MVAAEYLRGLQPDVVIIMNPVYGREIGASLATMGLAPEMVSL